MPFRQAHLGRVSECLAVPEPSGRHQRLAGVRAHAAGDTVTITGQNFTVVSSTQIRTTSPAVALTAVGYMDVRVYAADRLSATNTNARFLYL